MIWTWDIFGQFEFWLMNQDVFDDVIVYEQLQGLQLIYDELVKIHYVLYVIMIIMFLIGIGKIMKWFVYSIKDVFF